MKVYQVSPGKGFSKVIEKDINDVMFWIEDIDIGDVITIKAIEMSEVEYQNLSEYMGP